MKNGFKREEYEQRDREATNEDSVGPVFKRNEYRWRGNDRGSGGITQMRSSVEEERELRVVRPRKDRAALLKPAVTRESLVGARDEVDLARLKPSKTWRTQMRGIIGWNTVKAGPRGHQRKKRERN